MSSEPLKIAFAGTPAFAATALESLLAAGQRVELVLTQPDRPAGRGLKLSPSPVKQLALAHGIAVDQPERLKTDEARACLRATAPDLLIVVAYGLILPREVLALPRLGCINIHASLLPRWRGAAPIHRAIEAGDAETGVTLMQMDEGLDTGPMLLSERLPILPEDSTASLHDKLAALGGRMLVELLPALVRGEVRTTPQPDAGVCYAHKIDKTEARIDWRQPASEIERRLRAFDPFPGVQARLQGTLLKLWRASVIPQPTAAPPGQILAADEHGIQVACGREALCITCLQKPGGKRLSAREFLAGFPVDAGQNFELEDA